MKKLYIQDPPDDFVGESVGIKICRQKDFPGATTFAKAKKEHLESIDALIMRLKKYKKDVKAMKAEDAYDADEDTRVRGFQTRSGI